ncbi:hypothetical protein MHAS44199_08205 [Mycolicibacterium hassiacum DSM 44199]|nr:hypothetical protein [Mycolicibacterium hassiacum DSM 44199]
MVEVAHHIAAMRLRLRDGDHLCVRTRTRSQLVQLQCGSVSGTEITRIDQTQLDAERQISLQCGSVSGTEITRIDQTQLDAERQISLQMRDSYPAHLLSAAAMRLRLRDGDHPD